MSSSSVKNFYDDGLRFSCRRCSFCCGTTPGFVYLSKRDLTQLCKFFNLAVREFVSRYCRWADYYGGTQVLALKEKSNCDCILWKDGCSAYSARPVQCETYPFWTWMISDASTWNECARDCPGMNKGELHDAKEIAQASARYTANVPLTKEETESLY